MITGVVAAANTVPSPGWLTGQGWRQVGELALATVLSASIGLEREVRQKDAGLRTHTLVGIGAALFMLISKYGFADVLESKLVVLDPSRVAAQIVSGIGFIGAGLIFVRRDAVRGLTTAASIWLTAAIGAAAGAGLLVLAAVTTGLYFVVTLLFTVARQRMPWARPGSSALRVRYPDGRGILREVLNETTRRGFTIDEISTEPAPDGSRMDGAPAMVSVTMHVHGKRPASDLVEALTGLEHVEAVVGTDYSDADT